MISSIKNPVLGTEHRNYLPVSMVLQFAFALVFIYSHSLGLTFGMSWV
jgi:hypothetical protein